MSWKCAPQAKIFKKLGRKMIFCTVEIKNIPIGISKCTMRIQDEIVCFDFSTNWPVFFDPGFLFKNKLTRVFPGSIRKIDPGKKYYAPMGLLYGMILIIRWFFMFHVTFSQKHEILLNILKFSLKISIFRTFQTTDRDGI